MPGEEKHRTQLYLNEAQHLFLKESAAKYNTSIAEVVRALIDREMGGAEAPDATDPLFRLAETAVATGRTDGAQNHDRYLYGAQPIRARRRKDAPAEGDAEG